MTYYVLNKKTHLFTSCDSVDEAWKVVTDMLLEHSFRADIDIISTDEEKVKSVEAFAKKLGKSLPEETSPFQQSKDDFYISVNILALVPGEPTINNSVDLTFPVTKQEFDSILENNNVDLFIMNKAEKVLQTAKRWPEVVGSCYDFNWGDAFMTDILEEALHAIPDEEVPDGIRSGRYGHYARMRITVNHDTCFLPFDVPVCWVGYGANGEEIAKISASLDMTSGSIKSSDLSDEVVANTKAARIFFKDGSSVDCDKDEDFMKLCEDESSVHLK